MRGSEYECDVIRGALQRTLLQGGFDYTPENKCKYLFAERGKFDYTWSSKHNAEDYEKYCD
jgi:hypothetical protein